MDSVCCLALGSIFFLSTDLFFQITKRTATSPWVHYSPATSKSVNSYSINRSHLEWKSHNKTGTIAKQTNKTGLQHRLAFSFLTKYIASQMTPSALPN